MKTLFLFLALALPAMAQDKLKIVQQNELRFMWQNNPATNVVAYRVYIGFASRTYTNFAAFFKTNACRGVSCYGFVPKPTSTNRVWFACTAVNNAGIESGFSNEVIWPIP